MSDRSRRTVAVCGIFFGIGFSAAAASIGTLIVLQDTFHVHAGTESFIHVLMGLPWTLQLVIGGILDRKRILCCKTASRLWIVGGMVVPCALFVLLAFTRLSETTFNCILLACSASLAFADTCAGGIMISFERPQHAHEKTVEERVAACETCRAAGELLGVLSAVLVKRNSERAISSPTLLFFVGAAGLFASAAIVLTAGNTTTETQCPVKGRLETRAPRSRLFVLLVLMALLPHYEDITLYIFAQNERF